MNTGWIVLFHTIVLVKLIQEDCVYEVKQRNLLSQDNIDAIQPKADQIRAAIPVDIAHGADILPTVNYFGRLFVSSTACLTHVLHAKVSFSE